MFGACAASPRRISALVGGTVPGGSGGGGGQGRAGVAAASAQSVTIRFMIGTSRRFF